MQVFGLNRGFARLSKYSNIDEKELSHQGRDRLRALRLMSYKGVRAASITFGVSRATLYRWKARFNPHDLQTLEERSRRPHRVQPPQWLQELEDRVLELRRTYPRWGKDKLTPLLHQEGQRCSVSTVGRILKMLKERGLLKEPPRAGSKGVRRRKNRPWARRKPRGYLPEAPGDLLQIDVMDQPITPGVRIKHFTAVDMYSRWNVIQARGSATAATASEFLTHLLSEVPFVVKAIQVDGGSEFYAQFEQACQTLQIQLFQLPPRSPKLNGMVERAHLSHKQEFYQVYQSSWRINELNQQLTDWQTIYNTIRPHAGINHLTPLQLLQKLDIIPESLPPPRIPSHMY